jgi:hypothetical protein
MQKKWTHRACFEHFGTVPANLRWSWSPVSSDMQTVAVTLWQDRFEESGTVYRSAVHSSDERWLKSPGHGELLRNLKWARDHCGGKLKTIIAIPDNPKASPRS